MIPRALATVAAGAALAAAAVPATAADPILPLSEVRPGMTGTAHTVVRGEEITTFPVTVLDVIDGGGATAGQTIIIRAEGPLMDQTGGIASGMSGSPVYVTGADGVRRLMGAVAYGEGDERNVIGGVTPIERMLEPVSGPRSLSRAPAARRSLLDRPVRIAPSASAAARMRRADPGAIVLQPLMRWTVSGLDTRLVPSLRRSLGTGVQLQSTGARATRPAVTLRPGASLTALVLGGDLALGAIGTVTYVDGPTVLGFGHPFLGAGATRLLMGDGHITTVVAAPIRSASYKLGEPGTLQGMITQDRRDGVVGVIGPVDAVTVTTRARDTRRQATSSLETLVAPQPELVPLLVDLAQAEPLLRVRDGVMSGTVALRLRVRTPGLGTFTYRNAWAAAGDVATLSSGRVGAFLATIAQNPIRGYMPRTIEIDQTLRPEVSAGVLRSARVVPAVVRPGQRARLVLTLRMWRAGNRRITVPVRIPRDLPRGRVGLRIVPNDPNGFDPALADLTSGLSGEAVEIRDAQRRAVPRAGATGTPAARIRAQLARAADDRHDAVRLLAPGEENTGTGTGVEIPTEGIVVSGGRAVARVRVR